MEAACTTGKERRIKRWEHEDVLDAMQRRLDQVPQAMAIRRQTAEHCTPGSVRGARGDVCPLYVAATAILGRNRSFAHKRLRVARQPYRELVYSPTLLSTLMLPACCCVTMS
jgi:hypothetical protein